MVSRDISIFEKFCVNCNLEMVLRDVLKKLGFWILVGILGF